MVVLCLLALIAPRTTEATRGITEQARQSAAPSRFWDGFEIGPTFSLTLPVASACPDEIGLDAGLSLTAESAKDPNLGTGLHVAYHYWPVSAEFKQEFNTRLRTQLLNTLQLGDGIWGLQVTQFGVHVRVAASAARGAGPWLQVGGSVYSVNPHTSGYSGDAGFATVAAPPLPSTQHFGCSVVAGVDVLEGPRARMGLETTYHFVACGDRYGEDLQIVTVGARMLFGW